MFGPRCTVTPSMSSAATGISIKLSLILNTIGISTLGALPSVVGSVNTPAIADAAAVSGDTKYTCASAVPLRAKKLRLNVRKLTPADCGEKPIPIQGPHAHSKIRAPALIRSARAPHSASIVYTCFEPGEMDKLTSGCTVLPLSIAATVNISASDELVHEPIHT